MSIFSRKTSLNVLLVSINIILLAIISRVVIADETINAILEQSIYLYYYESDDALLDVGESQIYTFAPLPGENITIAAYGLDDTALTSISLFDNNNNLIANATTNQVTEQPPRQSDESSQSPFISAIQHTANSSGLYSFEVKNESGKQGLIRTMLFVGEPFNDDLTLIDELNPLLPSKAFMVAGDPNREWENELTGQTIRGLRTQVDVQPIERIDREPDVFTSYSTLSYLPNVVERLEPVNFIRWFNEDEEEIYLVNIRPLPEEETESNRAILEDLDYQTYNSNNFFFFEYFFTVGNGSDPIALDRGAGACAGLADRIECVSNDPNLGREDGDDTPIGLVTPTTVEQVTFEVSGETVTVSVDTSSSCTSFAGTSGNVATISVEGTISQVCLPSQYVNATGTATITAPGSVSGTVNDCTGTNGDDIIACTTANDYVEGLAGNDAIFSDAGNDVIEGGTGEDFVIAGTGDDIVNGGAGYDAVDGGPDNDTINLGADGGVAVGGTGEDTFIVDSSHNASSAQISGGEALNGAGDGSSDTFDFNGNPTGTIILYTDNQDGLDFSDYSNGITVYPDYVAGSGLSVIVINGGLPTSISGSNSNDTFNLGGGCFFGFANGCSSPNQDYTVNGNGGIDTITTGSGDDTVNGGSGDDIINTNFGDDIVDGGIGNDTINTGFGNDSVTDNDGDNIIDTSFGNDTVVVGDGNNTINTGFGDDGVTAGDGNNIIDTGFGNDTVDTGNGNNTIDTGFGTDIINSGSGNDTINAGGDNDTVNSGGGDDTIDAGDGNDTIDAGDGNDLILGNLGNDLIEGGNDTDTLSYETVTTTGVTVNIPASTVSGTGIGDSITNIENISGTNQDDIFFGDGNDNIFDGLGHIIGDTIDYSGEADSVFVDLSNQNATGTTIGTDTLINIELIEGTEFDDTLIGSTDINIINGNGGDDLINDGAGNDTVNAGSGNDIIEGSAGDDTLDGGAGSDDLLDLSSATDVLTVYLGFFGLNQSTSSEFGTDTLSNLENISGGSGNDTLVGGSVSNDITGGAGNDTIGGDAGDDNLFGEAGDDTIYGGDSSNSNSGDGNDFISGGDGNDTIFGESGDDTIDGDDGDDTIDGGAGADTISGGDDDDTIDGGAGNDILSGDDGDDTISGGAGNDTLDGGAGNDTLDGGAGTDLIDESANTDDLDVTLNNVTGTIVDGFETDDILNVENVFTGSGDDTFDITDSGNNLLDGGDGDDSAIITGSSTSNAINVVRTGTDVVVTGTGIGIDTYSNIEDIDVLGGTGNDSIVLNDGSDNNVDGNGGSDLVTVIKNEDTDGTITVTRTGDDVDASGTGIGNDVYTNISNVNVTGSTANDTLDLIDENDNIFNGVSGDDTVNVTSANNGGETISILRSGSDGEGPHVSVSSTGIGEDTYLNTDQVNVTGGDGSDSFEIFDGLDNIIDGGAGTDIIDYSNTTDVINVVFDVFSDNLVSGTGIGTDILISIENIISGGGDDSFAIQDEQDNEIDGGGGDDEVFVIMENVYSGVITIVRNPANIVTVQGSGYGTDTYINIEQVNVESSTGDDIFRPDDDQTNIFDADGGTDWIDYSFLSTGVNVNLATGTATGDGTDTLLNFENIEGTSADDTLTGDGNDNVIRGSSGNDTIDGGAGTDTFDEENAGSAMVVTLTNGNGSSTGQGTDTLSNIENVNTGSGNDVVNLQDAVQNIIDVNGGSDTINVTSADTSSTVSIVRSGNDVTLTDSSTAFGDDQYNDVEQVNITGGSGTDALTINDANNNVIDGAGGTDSINYSSSTNDITLTLDAATTAAGTDVGTDTLSNIEGFTTGSGNDSFIFNTSVGTITIDAGTGTNQLYDFDAVDGSISITDSGTNFLDFRDYTDDVDIDLSDSSSQALNFNLSLTLTGTFTNISGSDQADIIVGTNSADTIYGGADNDQLSGGGGDDLLVGEAGNDTINGDAGADTLNGGDGNDTLDGGADTDFIDESANTTGLVVTFNNTTGSIVDGAETDTVSNVENIDTGSGVDTFFISDSDDNVINANGGDDVATVSGGSGTITVIRSGGDVAVFDSGGGIGTDQYNSVIQINVSGSASDDTFIISDASDNEFNGLGGTDTIDYATTSDDLTIDFTSASTAIATGGGFGTDTLINFEEISTDSGDDLFIFNANAGTVTVNARAGDNTFDFDNASGDLGLQDSGGNGFLDFIDYTESVLIDLGSNASQNVGTGLDVTLTGTFTNISGSAFADNISGTSSADLIYGGGSDDDIWGEGGADNLFGEAGNDTIDGGAGDDTIDGGIGDDTLSGGDNDDTITGGTGADTIDGGIGDDTLSGGDDIDTISGGAGDDILDGGEGNDILDGGADTDTIDESASTNGLGVTLNNSTGNITDGTEVDSVIDVENVNTGSGLDTFFIVDTDDNIINAGGDDDVVNVFGATGTISIIRTGDDVAVTATSGVGSDQYNSVFQVNVNGSSVDDIFVVNDENDNNLDGQGGDDTISYATVSTPITVTITDSTAVIDTSGIGIDTLTSIENIFTGAQDDYFDINGTVDYTLNAGAGADTFFFNTTVDGTLELATSDNAHLDFSAFTSTGINIDLSDSASQAVTGSLDITLTGTFTTISGTTLADSISGTTGSDTIWADSGNDVIDGGAGDDLLYGNDGTDTIDGGAGDDTIIGGTGNDNIDGGTDVSGDTLDESSSTNDFTVTLTDGAGTSIGEGTDTLTDIENISTGSGDDTFTISDADNNIIDANGNSGGDDVVTVLNAGGNVTITRTGNDVAVTATTGVGIDQYLDVEQVNVSGTAGDEVFTITDSLDNIVNGLGGTNEVDYSAVTAVINVNALATSTTIASTGIGNDTLINIQNVTTGSGDDIFIIEENGLDNIYDGGADTTGDTATYTKVNNVAGTITATNSGSSVVIEVEGSDTDQLDNIETINFVGSTADDTFVIQDNQDNNIDASSEGGNGDTYDASFASSDITIDTSGGTVTASDDGSEIGTDTLVDFENIVTGDGDDTFVIDTDVAGTYFFNAGGDNTVGNIFEFIGGGTQTVTITIEADEFAEDTLDFSQFSGGSIDIDLSDATTQTVGSNLSITFNNFVDHVIGSDSADTITGNSLDNNIEGGGGDDTIVYSEGDDTVQGDAGTDTVDYSSAPDSVTVTLDDPDITVSVSGTSDTDTITTVEVIEATSNDDTIIVNDAVSATVNAGGGTDTVDYSGLTDAINVDLSTGNGNVEGTPATDDHTLNDVEDVIGSNFDDTIVGNAEDNTLDGGDGDDLIQGGDGDDTISGGDGDDDLRGEGDDDTIDGGDDEDKVHGGSGDDDIDGGADDDLLLGGNISGTVGDDGADIINGGTGDDVIYGGNDNTDGGANDDLGIDTIDGEAGDDIIYGGNNNEGAGLGFDDGDNISGGDDLDTIYGGNNNSNGGGATGTTGDDDGDTIYGNNGNDTIYGGNNNSNGGNGDDGSDTDAGGAGDNTDTIEGGSGNDTIYGGNNNNNSSNQNDDRDNGAGVGDTIEGNDGNDDLYGGNDNSNNGLGNDEGSDTITDTADTGSDTDTVYGGNNNTSTGVGTDGADTIDVADGDNNDTATDDNQVDVDANDTSTGTTTSDAGDTEEDGDGT